jgi:hypothetical protein
VNNPLLPSPRGTAFPCPGEINGKEVVGDEGLTAREYAAIHALPGLLAARIGDDHEGTVPLYSGSGKVSFNHRGGAAQFARLALELADALLAATRPAAPPEEPTAVPEDLANLMPDLRSAFDGLLGAQARMGLPPLKRMPGPKALGAAAAELLEITRRLRGLAVLLAHGKTAEEETP